MFIIQLDCFIFRFTESLIIAPQVLADSLKSQWWPPPITFIVGRCLVCNPAKAIRLKSRENWIIDKIRFLAQNLILAIVRRHVSSVIAETSVWHDSAHYSGQFLCCAMQIMANNSDLWIFLKLKKKDLLKQTLRLAYAVTMFTSIFLARILSLHLNLKSKIREMWLLAIYELVHCKRKHTMRHWWLCKAGHDVACCGHWKVVSVIYAIFSGTCSRTVQTQCICIFTFCKVTIVLFTANCQA